MAMVRGFSLHAVEWSSYNSVEMAFLLTILDVVIVQLLATFPGVMEIVPKDSDGVVRDLSVSSC